MKKVLKSKLVLFMLVVALLGTQCFSVLQPMADSGNKENTIVETGTSVNDVDVTVLESDSYHTIVKFDVNNFDMNLVNIDNEDYYTISCDGTGIAFDKGMPELPRISRSIAIPSNSTATVNVIDSEYTDYKKTPVTPSKGSITRDKNPMDIPYTFDDVYKKNDFYPAQLASLSDTFIMREMTGTTVTVNAFQYKPASETLRVYDSVTVEIITEDNSSVNSLATSSNNITADFEPAYENTFINYSNMQQSTQGLMNNPSETGSMLIITYDSYASALDSFVTWKNSKGIATTVVNMSTVSSTNSATAIKSYIQTYYNAHPELTYVLLVGDYAQVSSPAYSDGVSDPEYTKVAGSDNYPDIYVGRFSAQSLADVQTQVQRSMEFEQNGYNTTTWFKKGLGLASAEGSGETDIEHMDIIRTNLLNDGYTTVDSVYDPSASASAVTTSLNAGRGIVNYVGHGADTYWVTSGFDTVDVANLDNAGQLPFILSVACVNGTFQKSTTCFAEAWMRSKDSSGNPIGAIGTLMSTVNQPWTPPMNGQDEIINLLINDSRISLGGLCYSGETVMLDNGTSDDILTFNTWTLFGDPSIQIEPTGTPPTPSDTYEPNETTTAAYGPLTSGTTYNSYIFSATDVDYYKFTTAAAGTIAVTCANLPVNYDLYLYNSTGTQVASSLNSGTTSESISYTSTAAGTYYAKVIGNSSVYSTTSAYALTATYPTTPPSSGDTYEPNASTSAAYGPITSGTAYNSYIYSSTDVDYYKFTTTAAGTIAVTCTNLAGDYDIYLYNSAGTSVASSLKSGTTNESISYTSTAAGTYYVKVLGYNGVYSTTQAYALTATYPTSTTPPTGQWYNETTVIQSPHDYTNSYNNTQTYTKAGATKVAVHFSRFETESNYDFVYIKDAAGTTQATYSGTLDAFTAEVDGDTIQINLVSDYSVTGYGYYIDYVSYYSEGEL